jgi:hypothetical protein
VATVEQVKKAILEIAGEQTSEVLEDLARAIVALDDEATKETRVIEASEKR